MNLPLKLGIILDKKSNLKNLETLIEEILYPHLSSSPIKEIYFGNKYTKSEMKEIYRDYKLDNYKGISNKKKNEDMKNRGIDTLEGFAKEIYNIIRFTDEGEAVFGDNPKGFIDEYKIDKIDRLKNYNEEFLTMNLKSLIDKDLKVYHRELQTYRRTPSSVITPVLQSQNKNDYLVLINYQY